MKPVQINPRKTPRQARAKVTYDVILEAAARILDREDLARFNTNRVAEVAGVSVGTLYQYFPTKESILTEIIRQRRKLMLDGLRQATQAMDGETFAQTLDRLLHVAIAHQLEFPGLARTLEYAEASLPLEREAEELRIGIVQTVAAFLEHHHQPDAQERARDLVAALRGMIDAAGLAGETDATALFQRARRLSVGYLA